MVENIKIGGLYQHYKGMKYKVISLAKHSESLEWMVCYECLYENSEAQLWVRPLTMFCETVEVKGVMTPRFKYIDEDK